MAYGTIYTLYCKDKTGITSMTVISEDGYSGSEIDRNVPANPFFPRKDASSVICGSSFEFLIREETDFEFLKFYTNLPRKYKIQFYYPSTTLIWTGYLNPQQYSVPYIPGPSNIRLQATDGLGLLKSEAFTLTGLNSELTIIRHCLDKIELSLGYAIAIGIHEINHDDDYCPLAQTYIECEILEDKNCYQVLEGILTKYDASITQWNNRWRIVSYKDKKTARLLYTSAGVYEGTEAAPSVLDLGTLGESGCEVYPNGSLFLSLQSGGNKVRIIHDYGRKKSILLNYEFEKYSSSMFDDWSKSGTFSVLQRSAEGKKYAFLSGYSNVDTDYISQQIAVENITGEEFAFELDFTPIGYNQRPDTARQATSMTVRFSVYLTDTVNNYWLSDDGWTTTPTIMSQTVSSSISYPTFNNLKIITDEIPITGTIVVQLYRIKSTGPTSPIVYSGVAFSEPSIYFLKDGELYDDKFDDIANFDSSTEPAKLPDINILAADSPDFPNCKNLYDNITRLSTGAETTIWHIDGNDTDFTLIQALAKMLASRNIYPRQKLTGTIKGTGIGFESIIKHAFNNNREFEIYEGTWDVFEGKWNLTLLEFFAFSDQDVTFDSGLELNSAANLTVITVSAPADPIAPSEAFDTTIHIDNTGESTGRGTIEWKIVNGSDVTQSSGTHASGVIAASGHEDHVIGLTAPATEGTYYVKSRMATDTSWVSSSSFIVAMPDVTLNHIDTIADGPASGSMTFTFEADNAGGGGNVTVYWQIYDSGDNVVDSGSQVFDMDHGIHTYAFTGVTYPATPGTGYYNKAYLSGETPIVSNTYEVTSS